jgi:3-phosphoshikimate 1-carboxyvinyltransferase
LSAAAALPGSDITVKNLFKDNQGERAILEVLQSMGATIKDDGKGTIRLIAPKILKAVEFDGDRATDAVLAMVGAACMAEGESQFYNVENLRYKECDRITEPLAELNKLGVLSHETQSEIFITGCPEGYDGGIEVDSCGDHRVIMLLSIVGMRSRKGLTIDRAEHISKSYPNFFDDLRALNGNVEIERY